MPSHLHPTGSDYSRRYAYGETQAAGNRNDYAASPAPVVFSEVGERATRLDGPQPKENTRFQLPQLSFSNRYPLSGNREVVT